MVLRRAIYTLYVVISLWPEYVGNCFLYYTRPIPVSLRTPGGNGPLRSEARQSVSPRVQDRYSRRIPPVDRVNILDSDGSGVVRT